MAKTKRKFLATTKGKYLALINWTKKFFKEIKRTRWPKVADANRTYVKVLVFVSIIALILFGIAILLTQIWDWAGVGING